MQHLSKLLLLSFLMFSGILNARHIMGGYIRYSYNNNGILRINAIVYRDCAGNGAVFDSPAQFAVYDANGVLFNTFNVPVDSSHYNTLMPDNSGCTAFVEGICVETGYYSFALTLPADNMDYTVAYQRCCRTLDVANLIAPESSGITLSITITAAARTLKNSSPVWQNDPVFALCAHTPAIVPLGATDIDDDLLVYSFSAPKSGGGPITTTPDLYSCEGVLPQPPCPPPFDVVAFAVPNYTFNNPLNAQLSNLNSVNGEWTITPDYSGKFVYGYSVQEYRDGELLSTTLHDLTVWVMQSLGLQDDNQTDLLVCSPNPAGDVLYLANDAYTGAPAEITVTDLTGKVCLQVIVAALDAQQQLAVGHLPTGVYVVRMNVAGKVLTGKFIRE